MGFTPLDVENTRFRGALAGYNRIEVEQFMLRVAAALEEKLEEIQRLKLQINELEIEVQRNREIEDLLKNSVILAQKTCDELISSAHSKADLIRQEAQAEGQQIKWHYAELKSDKEQFEYAFHGLLSGFMHRLEQGNPALNKPAETTTALPPQQPGEPADIALEGHLDSAQISRGNAAIDEPQTEILTTEKTPSLKLPFAQKPELPKVRLTQSQGQSVDRDADIDDFENAVADAKADEQPRWEPTVEPEDTQLIEHGHGEQEKPVEDTNAETQE